MNLQHDGKIDISIGKYRKAKTWRAKEITWSQLLTKLSQTHRTAESYTEYLAASVERQAEIKDIGGFVGGMLASGRRKAGNVVHRQLVTLDADFADPELWERFTMLIDCAACYYTTHKHHPEKPRLRLILPLDREVLPDEYVAIARKIAAMAGINCFDSTTYQPERLMYWPSTSKDGEYLFEYQDGPWISADWVLGMYKDWKDSSQWPMGDNEKEIPRETMKNQGDPHEKPGLIGAFCRTYSIQEAIAKYLSDIYQPCDTEDRYTYVHGSTAGGLVIYEDKYAFSHHGTDPISGRLCNAFDLVRIHKFGLEDEKAPEDTPINRLPSSKAMNEFAAADPSVRVLINTERALAVKDDFRESLGEDDEDIEDQDGPPDMTWTQDLDTTSKGQNQNTIKNLVLILENDPRYKGKIAFDSFAQQMVFSSRKIPWRPVDHQSRFLKDSDVHQVEYHIETQYNIPPGNRLKKAFSVFGDKYSFHPIKDFLDSVQWDGTPRVDTLLIEYMGAEDSDYVRAVTRKTLVAAVARIFTPGCKFDYMLTLVGPQGKKKSSLWDVLGGEWFSDTFSMKTLEKGKEGMEAIRGVWIQEVPELTGLSKADVNHVKSFLGSRKDRYRPPYAETVQEFPRQCIIVGTTNNWDFLRDSTGNRRFWPVDILHGRPTKDVYKDLTEDERRQIWAEAREYYRIGEPLYLSPAMEVAAMAAQADHTEVDERMELIREWLEKPVPAGWVKMTNQEKAEWKEMQDFEPQGGETETRDHVTAAEIWTELFGGKARDMNTFNTKFIHEIMVNMPGWERCKSKKTTGRFGKQIVYKRAGMMDEMVKTGGTTRNFS